MTAENHGWNTGEDDGAHAHRAGFQCYIEGSIQKPPGTEFPCGFSDGDQFGVGGRILGCFAQIMSAGDDPVAMDDYASDRHLFFGPGLVSFGDGSVHPVNVIFF